MILSNKRILYIAPRFFGYEQDIKQALVQLNSKVNFLLDRPLDSSFMKGLTQVNRCFVMSLSELHYRKILHEFAYTNYNLIFIANNQNLSPKILSEVHYSFPAAIFVLYLLERVYSE